MRLLLPLQDPQQNVARGMNATADSTEADKFSAAKAVDGDTSSSSSRWASAVDATASQDGGPHWIYVDLGQQRDVKCVRVFWELRKAKGYKIQIANGATAPAVDSSDWQTVYTNDGHPASKTDLITLDQVHQARFVRLYIDHNTYADPDGGVAWGNVSIFELEVYGGTPKMDMNGLADAIKVEAPRRAIRSSRSPCRPPTSTTSPITVPTMSRSLALRPRMEPSPSISRSSIRRSKLPLR